MSGKVEPTDKQLSLLRHMLGISNQANKKVCCPYRNYYCANPGDPDMMDLQRAGLAEKYADRDGYEWYKATDLGQKLAIKSFAKIRYPKGKRVYLLYLDAMDAGYRLSFKEFLVHPEFAEYRRNA